MIAPSPHVLDLMRSCHSSGFQFARAENSRVQIDAPAGKLSDQLLAVLRTHKAEMLDILEWIDERAAIMEFDGGLSRSAAESQAWRFLYDQESVHNTLDNLSSYGTITP